MFMHDNTIYIYIYYYIMSLASERKKDEIKKRREKRREEIRLEKEKKKEKKQRRLNKRLLKEKLIEREKLRREMVIPQDKEPDKIQKQQRKKDREDIQIEKDLKELEETGKEASEVSDRLERLNFRNLKKLSKGGILDLTSEKNKKKLSDVIDIQQTKGRGNLCKGVFNPNLVVKESKGLDSLSKINNNTITAVLTYLNNRNNIKISLLCSSQAKGGSSLLKVLESKFPGKDLKVDSVPGAIGFYKKQGFIEDGNTENNLTPMIKKRLKLPKI